MKWIFKVEHAKGYKTKHKIKNMDFLSPERKKNHDTIMHKWDPPKIYNPGTPMDAIIRIYKISELCK